MPKISSSTGCNCQLCNREFKERDFFKSRSRLSSVNGFMPICKQCFEKVLDTYSVEYGDDQKALKRLCMAYDLYYNDSVYYSCTKGGKTDLKIGEYIRQSNSLNNRGKTFEDTIEEGFTFKGVDIKTIKIENDDAKNSRIGPELIKKWGSGFEPDDYNILEEHYNFLMDSNPKCDSNQLIFINDLCYTKMQQMKAVLEKRISDYDKLTESYRKTFAQAGLKTTKEASLEEDFKIGVTAETIEKYTPAEYYRNKELFKDHDSIGDYFERFVLRPLKNLQHGTSDRDYEYFVKEENEAEMVDEDE